MNRIAISMVATVLGLAACTSGVGGETSPAESGSIDVNSSVAATGSSIGTVPVGRVVFDRNDTEFGLEAPYLGTFIVGVAGTEELVPTELEVETLSAVWSPDGDELLVNTWTPPRGAARPAIMHADGSGFTPLDPGVLPADMHCNAWSPNAKTLLCSIAGYADHPELDGMYTMPARGGVPTRLTISPEHYEHGKSGECVGGDHFGDYSPDGARIVFMRTRCGSGPDPSSDQTGALFVASADGRRLERITDFGIANSHGDGRVRWSPAGDWILFGTADGDLSVVRPDGSELTTIVPETGAAYAPDWSPDGRYIVFSMWLEETQATDLYVASARGSNLMRITDTEGSEDLANWGPDAPTP